MKGWPRLGEHHMQMLWAIGDGVGLFQEAEQVVGQHVELIEGVQGHVDRHTLLGLSVESVFKNDPIVVHGELFEGHSLSSLAQVQAFFPKNF